MNHSQSLPEASTDALNHSQKLVDVILKEIADNNGSISFKRYMEMALYQPQLGYYVAGAHKIGAQGDFITAPEVSPLFSQCMANQCSEILQKLAPSANDKKKGCILELGAGSGKMASEILLELEQQQQLPERYYILDLSPDLQQRQKQTIQQNASHLLPKVKWITSLPAGFTGIIIGNEVVDAMPVDVFTQQGTEVYEHHVIHQQGALTEQLKPANTSLKEQVLALNIESDQPYTSELNTNITPWLKTLGESLQQGVILLIDYGYTRREYYLAERNKGTLICHYQHLVNEAPLHYPGLQDITANVDFTALAEAADLSGLEVAGYTSQAVFLSNTNLERYFQRALDHLNSDTESKKQQAQYQLAQQIRTLTMPSEMGERFKCIALSKKYNHSLTGFSELDQRYRL